ncbi:MAG: PH domain-containing protein [Propionibacteriaceae bacterium]|nr:PH domain-containing protein [Propionibacteriaceae bacterium]
MAAHRGIGGAAGWALLRYFGTRFTLSTRGLELRLGIINRTTKTLAWQAVSTVEVDVPWAHRLLGVMNVMLAQSGEAAKIELSGVTADVLAEIRGHVAGSGVQASEPTNQPPTSPGTVLYQTTPGQLVVVALVRVQVLLLGAAALGSAWGFLDEWRLIPLVMDAFEGMSLVVGIGVCLVGAFLGDLTQTVLKYYGFQVRLEDDELVTSYGLLSRRERRIDPAVVRGLVLERNFVEQLLGRAHLGILTRDSEVELGSNTLLPSLPVTAVRAVAREQFPAFMVPAADLAARPPLARCLIKFILTPLIMAAGTGAAFWLGSGVWGLLAIPVFGVLTITLFRGLGKSFQLNASERLVHVRRCFTGERVTTLQLGAVHAVGRARWGRRNAWAWLATYAGSAERYWWLWAAHGPVEQIAGAIVQGPSQDVGVACLNEPL